MAEEIDASTPLKRHVCHFCRRYTGGREHTPEDIGDCPECGSGLTQTEFERAKYQYKMDIAAIGPMSEYKRARADYTERYGELNSLDSMKQYFYHWMELVKSGVRPEYRPKADNDVIEEVEKEEEEEEAKKGGDGD